MSRRERSPSPETITFIGVESAGKTTVARQLAKRLGGHALRVATWPTLEKFLASPKEHAFANQSEAMRYTLASRRSALRSRPHPLLADNSPDRIHLVHSWKLRRDGLLSKGEWTELEKQYRNARQQWAPHYVYLRVGMPTIRQRLLERGRPEDLDYNLQSAAMFMNRWESIVADPEWREGKKVLEVSGEMPLDKVCDTTELWVRRQLNKD